MSTTLTSAKLDLSDCHCVQCGRTGLAVTWSGEIADPGEVTCPSCKTTYEILDGIPYLMVLEESDFLSLVEIAGEFDSRHYDAAHARPLDDSWPELLERRHTTPDEEVPKLFAELEPGMRVQLQDRYEQWREIWLLSRDIDVRGKKVLVVGAGLGFDTNLLMHRGAKVTAVDLNPQTNAFGRAQTPAARWVGAVGRRLPFVDQAFDYVSISASLHHVLDVSATIVEMLRVLKPGGSLITTNDSFSRDATTDLEDVRMWNEHAAVLRGINENTPRLKVFIDPLIERANELDIEFWTSRAYGVWVEAQKMTMDFLMPRKWSLAHDEERLRNAAGGLFMKVTPRVAIASALKPPGPRIMKPSTLKGYVGRKREAMADIAHLAPPSFLSPAFPGAAGNTKFQVLNGWRWREDRETGREAYLLGRWWTRKTDTDKTLDITVLAPDLENATDPLFTVSVDGKVLAAKRAHRGERTHISADVSAARTDAPIAVEIGMDPDSEAFDQGTFRVEALAFAEQGAGRFAPKRRAGPTAEELHNAGLEIPGLILQESLQVWREIFDQQREWGQYGDALDLQPGKGRSTRVLLDLCEPDEKIHCFDYDDDRDPAVLTRGNDRLGFVKAGGEELGAALDGVPLRRGSVRFVHANPRPMFTVCSDVLAHSAGLIGVDGVLALNNCENTLLYPVWAGALHAVFAKRCDLKPFLIAHNYAYFCHARAHGRYMRFVRTRLFERQVKPLPYMLARTDIAPDFDLFRIAQRLVPGEPYYGENIYHSYLHS